MILISILASIVLTVLLNVILALALGSQSASRAPGQAGRAAMSPHQESDLEKPASRTSPLHDDDGGVVLQLALLMIEDGVHQAPHRLGGGSG